VATNRPQQRRTASRRPSAPSARNRAPQPSGQRRPAAAGPSGSRGFRGGLERASLPLITRLHRAPRWLVGALPGVVLLAGLLAPAPWGPALLGLVTLFLGWLLALSWPRLEVRSRALRTLVVVILAAFVAAQALDLL
jgi:VIT1/CCC1 family predicted Fe2+/Mn2+ transporter